MYFPQIPIMNIHSGNLIVPRYGQICQIWPYLGYLAISMHFQTTRNYDHDGYLWKLNKKILITGEHLMSVVYLKQKLEQNKYFEILP